MTIFIEWNDVFMTIVEQMKKLNEEFEVEVQKVKEKVDLLVKGGE